MTFGTWRWWGCQPHAPAALTPRNVPGTHFHLGLSRTQGHGTVGRKYVTVKSSDTTRTRSRDRPTSSAAPWPLRYPKPNSSNNYIIIIIIIIIVIIIIIIWRRRKKERKKLLPSPSTLSWYMRSLFEWRSVNAFRILRDYSFQNSNMAEIAICCSPHCLLPW
jgi:LPXTG-motif cell wall-anchored protein